MDKHTEFLYKKLYLIEHLSLRGKLAKDPILTEIHNICIESSSKIEERLKNFHEDKHE